MSLGDRFPIEPMSERDWAEVQDRVLAELQSAPAPRPSRPRPPWAYAALAVLAGAGALAAIAAVALWPPTSALPGLDTSRLESRGEPVRASLHGLELELAPHTTLLVIGSEAQGWVATLERGRCTFGVAPRQGRPPFAVQAGSTRVEVVGTRFTVERDADEVDVAVERGTVRLRHRDEIVLLHAGTRWRTPSIGQAASAQGVAPLAAPAASAPTDAPVEPSEPATSTEPIPAAPAGQSARALFEQATALEHASPERALGLYARVARLPGPWAAPALFAQGRLEVELGREAPGRAHLRRYLARHPDGLNAEDARRILARRP